MASKIQLRRDIAANWASVNPVLAQGEVGLVTDTGTYKFGDGTTAWNSLAAASPTTLDGVTIGATTPSPSITANTLTTDRVVTLSGAPQPWLNMTDVFTGSVTSDGALNLIQFNDTVAAGSHILNGLEVYDNVVAPATGQRVGIIGQIVVSSAGTQTLTQAGYVGVNGRAVLTANIGGTSGSPIGSVWGANFGATGEGTYMATVTGVEIDIGCTSGSSVTTKCGLSIIIDGVDGGVRGSQLDAAFLLAGGTPESTGSWKTGIMIGFATWPFASDSTIIGTGTTVSAQVANIGIDLSTITFSDAAIKTGAAPITMAEMASPPAQTSGVGKLYVASDGSLHYLGPTSDTQIAPA